MQTMPAKNRRAVTMGAILLGAVVVGVLAFFAFNREKEPTTQADNTYLGGTALEGETGEPVSAATTTPISAIDSTTDAVTGDGEAANMPETNAQAGGTEPANTAAGDAGEPVAVPATHVVAEGETLREISLKYYGDPVYAGDIEALNQLPDPNRLLVGQTLQLPKPEDLTR